MPSAIVSQPSEKRAPRKAQPARSKLFSEAPETYNGLNAISEIAAYVTLYKAAPGERVKLIRSGIPAAALVKTGRAMGISNEQLFETLRFPRATVSRKISRHEVLSPEFSERVIGLQKLIGQVESMVAESGEADGFDPAKWVANWLNTPCPALGGAKPAEYMDTAEGQALASKLLSMMQSGAYA
jgi:putative toxin-antitoxin system antitoxin component (TIGR02293 family)